MVSFRNISEDHNLIYCSDGAGLAAGVFNHLLERGDQCPKVLGATHFHGIFRDLSTLIRRSNLGIEIFESGFLLPHERLAFGHFEVRVDPQSQQIDEQLTYLYKYAHIKLDVSR